jgi:hypothetical protein
MRNSRSRRRSAAICGIVGPAVFTTGWIVAGLVQRDYDATREDISGLAAPTASHPWIMIVGLAVAGVLTAIFGIGLHEGIARGSRVGPALVAFAGIGLAGLGVLRNDCSSMTVECKARVAAGDVSWHHMAHDVLSAPVFAAAILAPLVLALRFAREPQWRRLAQLSVATAPVLIALFVLGGVEAIPSWTGAFQRAAATVASVWMAVVAIRLLWVSRAAASRSLDTGASVC